jgi:Myb-like DNA-binding domain
MGDASLDICAGLLLLRRSSSSRSNSNMQVDSPPAEIDHPPLDARRASNASSSSNMQVDGLAEIPEIQLQLDECIVRRVEPVHKRAVSDVSTSAPSSPDSSAPSSRRNSSGSSYKRAHPELELDAATAPSSPDSSAPSSRRNSSSSSYKRAHPELELDAATAPSTPDSAPGSSGRDSPAPWLSSVEDICESPSKLRRTAAAAAAADTAADESGKSSSGLARGYYSFTDSEDSNSSDEEQDDDDGASSAAQQQQLPAITYRVVRVRKKFHRYKGPPAVSAEPKVPNKGRKQEGPKWWTEEEDALLTAAVQELGDSDWKVIAARVGTRNEVQVRLLHPSAYKKQACAASYVITEALAVVCAAHLDYALCLHKRLLCVEAVASSCNREAAQQQQHATVAAVTWSCAVHTVLINTTLLHACLCVLCDCKQTQQQCLQRWRKVLTPGLKKGPWEPNEDAKLVELVSEGHANWGELCVQMPGRTSK